MPNTIQAKGKSPVEKKGAVKGKNPVSFVANNIDKEPVGFKANQKEKPPVGLVAHQENKQSLREKLLELISKRMKIRDNVLGHPKQTDHGDGLFGHFRQQNLYSGEAISGRVLAQYLQMILEIIFLMFALFLHLPIKAVNFALTSLNMKPLPFDVIPFSMIYEKYMLKAYEKHEKLHLVYEKDEHEKLPDIYPIGVDGKIDVSEGPLDPNDQNRPIDEMTIWKNGLYPNPSFTRAFGQFFAEKRADTYGKSTLDPLNTQRLYGDQSSEREKSAAPDPYASGALKKQAAKPH